MGDSRSFEGLLKGILTRLTLVERRISGPLPGRLSESGQEITDWNDATAAGFYWGNGAANQPVDPAATTWWVGTVQIHNGYRILQTLTIPNRPGTGSVYERWYSGSVWSAWALKSSGVAWGRVARTSTLALTTTITPIDWGTPASLETNGVTWDATNERLIVVTPGWYEITAMVGFSPGATGLGPGIVFSNLRMNGSNLNETSVRTWPVANNQVGHAHVAQREAVANDYFDVAVARSSGITAATVEQASFMVKRFAD